jgi:hypothetical protein
MSVQNVVPTLTSNECRDQPLDGSVLATNDTGFYPGSGRGRTSSSGVLGALYCVASGARRGGLQVWRERRPGLQVPEVLIEASSNIVAKAESVYVIAIHRRVPCGWGIALPFIGQGESDLQACRTILLRVEAWRAVPRSWRPSWRILFQLGRSGASSSRTGAALRAVV